MLKKLRVLFAVVMGAVITFYFLDFAGLTTGWPNLARIQFVPALLAGSFGIVLILLVATLLFGRIYCSVICPMLCGGIRSLTVFQSGGKDASGGGWTFG